MSSERLASQMSSDEPHQEDYSTNAIAGDGATTKSIKYPARLFHFAPGPYAMYLATTFYFVPLAINMVAFQSVIYNKLCYVKFKNASLCTNSTFTTSHPALQVSLSVDVL